MIVSNEFICYILIIFQLTLSCLEHLLNEIDDEREFIDVGEYEAKSKMQQYEPSSNPSESIQDSTILYAMINLCIRKIQ